MSAVLAHQPPKLRWTPERVDLLKQLAVVGTPAAEIAERFGISKNAAATKMTKIGARSILTAVQRERIEELFAAGWRDSRIAKQIGIAEGDVMRHLHTSGLRLVEGMEIRQVRPGPTPGSTKGSLRRKFSTKDDDTIRRMTAEGHSGSEIGIAIGRTPNSVYSRRALIGAYGPATTNLAVELAAEIAATEAKIGDLQVTLEMMRSLAGRLSA